MKMEYIINIWNEIKARLWEGVAESLLIACHEDDYAMCMDLARSLRGQFDIPVSVKQSSTLEVGGNEEKIEPGTVFTITEMSRSLFCDAYFSIGKLEGAIEI
jgi:hypothetical protein